MTLELLRLNKKRCNLFSVGNSWPTCCIIQNTLNKSVSCYSVCACILKTEKCRQVKFTVMKEKTDMWALHLQVLLTKGMHRQTSFNQHPPFSTKTAGYWTCRIRRVATERKLRSVWRIPVKCWECLQQVHIESSITPIVKDAPCTPWAFQKRQPPLTLTMANFQPNNDHKR